ncbi:MAG: TRAP transporter substrate-binding protein [Lachnospiraceae bacterium]|nr:TRAP transporter substrate-binding protein [Lachnospiraceae bacterium]
MGAEDIKKKKLYLLICVTIAFAILLALFILNRKHTAVPEYVFSYAENQTKDYPTTMGGLWFAKLVEERTQGRIRIQVQPEGVFGSEAEVIRQMQYGGIDFARISIAQLADDIPEMKVLQLPYLYEDASHMWRVLDGEIGERFLEYSAEHDLIGLSWYDAGARNLYCTDQPIRRLQDMQGMRIRVQEAEMMSEMITALGAVPVQIPYDQVYAALERREVGAAENNWSSYVAMQHYEVAGYYTVDEHVRIPEMQICARHTWEQLTVEDRQIILECARESALYERRLWTEYEKRARETALQNNVEEIMLSAEEKKKFQAAMEPIYEQYMEDYGEDIEKILALSKE